MDLVTTGTITRELRPDFPDIDVAHVTYAIRRLRLEAVGVAGHARLFDPSALELVREFIVSKRKASGDRA